MKKLLNRLHGLDADEDGSAMTEFVIFLPVWVFMFTGIAALTTLNIETTRVQLMANKKLWDGVVPLTDYGNFEYSTKATNATAAAKHVELSTAEGNQTTVLDVAEGAAKGMGANGHWSESWFRVEPYQSLSVVEGVDDVTAEPEDIVGDRPYPLKIVNDEIDDVDTSGDFMSLVMSAVSASGLSHASAAGIRYGTVFGEVDDHPIPVAAGQSYDASAHFDIMVPPAPLLGGTNKVTYAVSRAMAETEDNYKVMMNFGEKEWEGESNNAQPGGLGDAMDDYDDMQDDEDDNAEEVEDERGDRCSDPENMDPRC